MAEDGMLVCLHGIDRIYRRIVQFCSELAEGGEQRYSRDIQNTFLENLFCSATQTHLIEVGRLSLGTMGQRPGSGYHLCCVAKGVTGR